MPLYKYWRIRLILHYHAPILTSVVEKKYLAVIAIFFDKMSPLLTLLALRLQG